MFSQKKLKIQIFDYDKLNNETIVWEWSDFPIDVQINKVVRFAMDAHIRIYGVSKEGMDAITTYQWKRMIYSKRGVKIFADDGFGEKEIYRGQINIAKPVYEQPNVYIDIQASAGAFQNTMGEIPPSSINGEASVPEIFEKIAKDYGLGFENKGVSYGLKYKNPYFAQKGLNARLLAASEAYNVKFRKFNNYIEIYPELEGEIYFRRWDLTKEDYIGYPSFNDVGISLNFDYIFEIEIGDVFYITGSEIEEANNKWRTSQITYNLSTKIGGKWFMQVNGYWGGK